MPTKPSTTNPLLAFYSPTHPATDPRGRTLTSILSWPDRQFESSHDYIQILFPLPEPSPFNYSAPVIDREVFEAFRSRPELRAQMRTALERMLKFYGFVFNRREGDEEEIVIQDHRTFYQRHWVAPRDHNHLRITRVLRCLRVLGLEEEAEAFFEALSSMCRRLKIEGRKNCIISDTSLNFWTRAAKRPLYLAPEDAEDRGRGRKFLYEFERSRMAERGSRSLADEAPIIAQNGNADEDQGPEYRAEKTQTSKFPATPKNQTNGFSNRDPSKAANIVNSPASPSNSSKRKFDGTDNEST